MEISTSTNICAFTPGRERNPLSFCIKECAKAGYRVLDINFCECMNPNSRMRDDDWEDYIRGIAALGRNYDLRFAQAHLPYYQSFPQQEEMALMEELLRRSLRACSRLGIRWAVAHPLTLPEQPGEACLQYNIDYFTPHLELARDLGVGIALENDFTAAGSYTYGADIGELVELADSFNDPKHMGICYDFGHGRLSGQEPVAALAAVGSRLKAVHIQDNRGYADDHLLPFHGNINWQQAMIALAKIDYQGDLTYEVQEHGRYFPNEHKHIILEESLLVGDVLLEMYQQAKAGK